jgi:A/G-specific adenine glycosylase
VDAFEKVVWNYYRAHGRHDLPWRQFESDGSIDPYKVLVSELMLQQTQVPRVIPKFLEFIITFPTFRALAAVPLAEVLKAWSGLGYNRRAKFLWQTAQVVTRDYNGKLPDNQAELVRLPGIGPNTAGALLAYAYNKPVVFIETNIRTVFIHHFFAGQEQVRDADIADAVAKAVPDNPREWYWALMDYGTYLKQTVGNLNTSSAHYSKQSAFHGSRRQIRGQVLRVLGTKSHTMAELHALVGDERLTGVLDDLLTEELIQKTGRYYKLAGA